MVMDSEEKRVSFWARERVIRGVGRVSREGARVVGGSLNLRAALERV